MPVLSDFDQILASLDPQPEGSYVYATMESLPEDVTPFAYVHEDEGVTVILPIEEARSLGLALDETYARITLRVHSALNSVGLTATIAQTMASRSLTCNVIAGYYHDHIFVQEDRVEEACALLEELALTARGWLPPSGDGEGDLDDIDN
ncbi:MAG: hypothetical protein CSA82_01905 [Actinobacteria bacterium]|nr:MAG: hypothetical protein CSA82_01905 [Actinomycetota bacterium]